MRYSRRISNYLQRITLSDLTHMMSIIDLININIETLRIDSESFLEKVFNELICINFLMVLYLIINQVDSCHDCVCGPLT